jgi:ring-1,2-phenylacetyl-CoA epoxidase subunit PaaC
MSLDQALAGALLAMADDELILAQRNSEWTGHAPILEEDIAFTNIALDEIGHAVLYYQLHAGLSSEDPESYPDRLVFWRPASEFRCLPFVEFPKGDWAFSMLRQYLFDMTEAVRLADLAQSWYRPLAAAAAKIQKEEHYHRHHTAAWVERLGRGTDESRQRMQTALDQLWPHALALFQPFDDQAELERANYLPGAAAWKAAWLNEVIAHLTQAGLQLPSGSAPAEQRGSHSPHLQELLEEMQCVARSDPQADW